MSRRKLLKKLLSNDKKLPKNYYLYRVEYNLDQAATVPSMQDKKENNISKPLENNFILNLVNDFYYETYSIKNLPKLWWILFLFDVLALWMFFSAIGNLQDIKDPTFIQNSLPFIYGVVFIGIFFIIRKVNEQTILKKIGKKYELKFENINSARIFWIQRKLGTEVRFFELAKELSEWKILRERYSEFFQYDYRKTIYNANAKPRVIALTIALISVCALLIMNISEVSYDEVVVQLATNFFYITILSPIIVIYFLFLAFVITLLWRITLMILDSFINKNIVSNIRFGFLIEFLTTYSSLKDNKKYRKF